MSYTGTADIAYCVRNDRLKIIMDELKRSSWSWTYPSLAGWRTVCDDFFNSDDRLFNDCVAISVTVNRESTEHRRRSWWDRACCVFLRRYVVITCSSVGHVTAVSATIVSDSMSVLMTAGKKAAQTKAAEKELKKKKKAAAKTAAANRFGVSVIIFLRNEKWTLWQFGDQGSSCTT